MKSVLFFFFLLLTPMVYGQETAAPEIPFDAIDPIKQMPANIFLGEVAGLALNSKGHFFVYTRTGSPGPVAGMRSAQLFEFDKDGKFVREIGENMYSKAWAHAVRVDKNDNIWVVDEAGQTIVKLGATTGRPTLVLGRRTEAVEALLPRPGIPLDEPRPPALPGYFNRETDVAFDPAGNIYVSDGYVNSRVAKFDKDGNWVKSWGEFGKAPGQFDLPHSIATDDKGNVYVADRNNNRIQVFDGDGNLLRSLTVSIPPPPGYVPNIPDFGQNLDGSYRTNWPNTLCITPGPTPVIYASDLIPGRIYKMDLNGKLLGYFGTTGRQLGQFGWIHALACPSENELWVGELLNWRIQKLTLHPQRASRQPLK